MALDQTIVSTLLAPVGNQFNGFDKVGRLASGYFVLTTVFIFSWGKLLIIFGRKNAMFVTTVLFEGGSLMCSLAQNMNTIIGGRVLAGVGGGGIQVIVLIVVSEVVPIETRALSLTLIGCTFAIASVMGPLIGGAFTTNVTWRCCFYINLPIGGLAAIFLFISFNPPKTRGTIREKLALIDYLDVFLLTLGLVFVLLALTFGAGNAFQWRSSAVIRSYVLKVALPVP